MSIKVSFIENYITRKTTEENIGAQAKALSDNLEDREVLRTRANGHEILKCRICQKGICSGADVFKVSGVSGYSTSDRALFFHKDCFAPVGYHHRRIENITGTDNHTELRLGDISCEFEMFCEEQDVSFYRFVEIIEGNTAFARVYVSLLAIGSSASGNFQQSSEDCTVTAETAVRNRDLYAVSAWLRRLTPEELAILNNYHCGAHIHVNANHSGTVRIYRCVMDKIASLGEDKRIEFFGSDFRGYAGNCVTSGSHSGAINTCPSTGCTIEFRLPRVTSAEQYVQCCKWWRATVNVVNKWYFKVASGEWSPEKLGIKAAKQVDRLLAGAFRKGE